MEMIWKCHHLNMYEYTTMIFYHFYQVNNFFDFLSAFLENAFLSKWDLLFLLLKDRGPNSFLQDVALKSLDS